MSEQNIGRAAVLMLIGMLLIGLIDNFVIVIAEEISLWQFHATRSAVIASAFFLVFGLGLADIRAKNLKAVIARGAFFSISMFMYFGSLAFLPIAVAVAGLFTSPILVMLITALIMRRRVGPVRWAAAGIGFCGILFVINPFAADFSPAVLVPLLAAVFYAISAIATRAWCDGETTASLLFWFFLTFGLLALAVMGIVQFLGPEAAPGPAGFLTRGLTWPSTNVWFWILAQAFVSIFAVGMITRAYQIGEASYVAVFEYSLMIFAPIWGWFLWQEAPDRGVIIGIVLIIIAGATIAVRTRDA